MEHQWNRQGKEKPARCRACGAMRCQNYPAGGMLASRCLDAGQLRSDGLVLCADCATHPIIAPEMYRAVNIRLIADQG